MTAAWIVAALALAALAAAIAWVALPVWHGAPAAAADDPRVVGLLVEREAVLATLRDLDDDARDGRIDAEDHRAQRSDAIARGAAVLGALDRLAADRTGDGGTQTDADAGADANVDIDASATVGAISATGAISGAGAGAGAAAIEADVLRQRKRSVGDA